MDDTGSIRRPAPRWPMIVLRKVVILVVVGFLFGILYDWASPWAFPPREPVGFGYGMLHGAMMPIALPTLVLGKDVAIYDNNNSGRLYKIGYICGINLCGLIFFGAAFYRPKPPLTSTSFDKPPGP